MSTDYTKWEWKLGTENVKGRPLTPEMLRKWSYDPRRELECIFCGHTLAPYVRYCPQCREYKGLQPFIEGWSD
jgi:hypothetical protein